MITADVRDYRAVAAALRTGADKTLRRNLSKALRDAGRPLAETVVREGAAAMPHRGGLSARLAGAKGTLKVGMAGSNPSVAITVTGADGTKFGYLNAGSLRHPVYGNRKNWVAQVVPGKAWERPFLDAAPEVRSKINEAVAHTLAQIGAVT